MIVQEACLIEQTGSNRLEVLRQQINDESYLDAAIKRLALVLSNELMGLDNAKAGRNERKRRK